MKLARIVSILLLLCLAVVFGFSQEKDKKSEPLPVEVKANLMVLDTANKFVDDIKPENLKIYEDGVEQKITYFVKKEPVLKLGLIVDNTGSTRTQMKTITVTGATIAANLRENDEAFIVRFVDSTNISILQTWTSDKAKLREAIQDMFTEGGQSAVADAIYLSANEIFKCEKKDGNAGRYALILVSDGEDRDSYYNQKTTLALFKGSETQIFALRLAAEMDKRANQKAQDFVNRFTFATGGASFSLKENPKEKEKYEAELTAALKALLIELRSQYVIGYTSTNPKRDGNRRFLRIEVTDNEKGEKRQALIREGFTVPEN